MNKPVWNRRITTPLVVFFVGGIVLAFLSLATGKLSDPPSDTVGWLTFLFAAGLASLLVWGFYFSQSFRLALLSLCLVGLIAVLLVIVGVSDGFALAISALLVVASFWGVTRFKPFRQFVFGLGLTLLFVLLLSPLVVYGGVLGFVLVVLLVFTVVSIWKIAAFRIKVGMSGRKFVGEIEAARQRALASSRVSGAVPPAGDG